MTSDIDTKRKQLAFRASHRGFKEADLVLGGFAQAHLGAMDRATLYQFERLMNHADQDIYDWVMERGQPEVTDFDALLDQIRAFVGQGGAVVSRK